MLSPSPKLPVMLLILLDMTPKLDGQVIRKSTLFSNKSERGATKGSGGDKLQQGYAALQIRLMQSACCYRALSSLVSLYI